METCQLVVATPEVGYDQKNQLITCQGAWTRFYLKQLQHSLANLTAKWPQKLLINGAAVVQLDSAGAWVLQQFCATLRQQGISIELIKFNSAQQQLLDWTAQHDLTSPLPAKPKLPPAVYRIGQRVIAALQQVNLYLAFIGQLSHCVWLWCLNPKRIRVKSIAAGVISSGYNAVAIISLLSFLIGVVLAYQMGVQLRTYGANVYVVDFLGIAILREFGPLLTAIIMAGRTGSAYAAQIGAMKLNEEVDALTTLGLSATEILALPKLVALLITIPLLTVAAEILGLAGGMVMAKAMLNVTYIDFLDRFNDVILLRTYLIGLVKAPVFALLIGSIGCFQGFQVKATAASVGRHTTIAVVQSIFMIIMVDAGFSVFYSQLGI
jgi:phospholipid/cholesterol/gamma-HCH transport system permease protein